MIVDSRKTQIQIFVKTRKRLKLRRLTSMETYDEIITRLLNVPVSPNTEKSPDGWSTLRVPVSPELLKKMTEQKGKRKWWEFFNDIFNREEERVPLSELRPPLVRDFESEARRRHHEK